MNELLGFVVLSGPLFLILIFLLASIVGIIVLRKKVTGKKRRLLGGLSIFGIAFFILFGDEVAGEMYLLHLCENKTEQIIHNQIKIPADFWNEDGGLKYPILKNGMADFKDFRSFYKIESNDELYVDFFIQVNKSKRIFFDVNTKKKAATQIYFSRKHGWLSKFSPSPKGGESCRDILIRKYGKTNYREMKNRKSQKFMNELFKK